MDAASAPVGARSFGKYTLVAKLATGGMAEIFLARLHGDGGFEKLVCIKRILPHLAKDPQFVAMFLDEARVVARISHPNVCQVFELGELDGQYYIAMEYLEGVPLSCFRRKDYYARPPDPRLVTGFAIQACEGLHHAHQLKRPDGSLYGVVHRDVSPQNLFVTIDGVVKVIDFGIAKVQDASVRTSTGAMKGTYAYMAPEQLRGELVDRRTDVFALGVVLWETLAQRHLFKRETDFLTFQAITGDPIPNISAVRPDVPALLGDAIARALDRDRDRRFASARALGEALGQAVAALGGPLSQSAISDEVETSFAPMVGEQRTMLQAAREGEAFDLNTNRKLGYDNRLVTTPVSNIRSKVRAAQAEVAEAVQAREQDTERQPVIFDEPEPPQRRSSPRLDTPGFAPATGTHQLQIQHSRLPWIIALVAVAIAAGAGTMLYVNQRASNPASTPLASMPLANEPPAVAALTPPAATAPVAAPPPQPSPEPSPAPVAAGASDAGVIDPTPPSDAAAAAVVVAPPIPDKHPQPKKVDAAPSGPPGFITIDSSPVYAVVFIDGKRYGETPLVRVSLAPGKHAVRAVSPSGAVQNVRVAIESGKTAPARRIEW